MVQTQIEKKALYRKYRPLNFENLVGQKHVQQALATSLKLETPNHAYLFTGPRGTGKTSSALLFARALNCASPVNDSACGTCTPCLNNHDIIERDAATFNSVDSIREMNESIGFAPMYGKYKIIILDEVHMLSLAAFNALLKTLEEPPSHVIFILASTEVHKIPTTIISRCQRFDFKRISNEEIKERLRHIAMNEDIQIGDNELALIAQASIGGLRDAIGLLDQASSMTEEKVVTMDLLLDLTGSIDVSITGQLILDILSNSIEQALATFSKAFQHKEPKFFIEETLIYLRDALMFKKLGADAPLKKAYMDRNFSQVEKALSVEKIYEILGELQKAISQVHYADDIHLFVELLIIKLISEQHEKSLQAQIDELRLQITNGRSFATSEPLEQVEIEKEFEEVSNPITFIAAAQNATAEDSDWTAIPLETPEHERIFDSSDEKETVAIESLGSEEIPSFSFNDELTSKVEATVDEYALSETVFNLSDLAEALPVFNMNNPSDIPVYDTNEETLQQDTKAEILSDFVAEDTVSPNNLILNEKQEQTMDILKSAHINFRQELLTKNESVLSKLNEFSKSTMAIYREFEIRAVNEEYIIMTHDERAKVKLIQVVKNRSLIEQAIEEVFKHLKIIYLTTSEWNEVVAVYKSQMN